MALHIQDKDADRMVREFARRRGLGITEAVKTAVAQAMADEDRALESVKRRIRPLVDEVRAKRADKEQVDQKAFMDEMWGEDD